MILNSFQDSKILFSTVFHWKMYVDLLMDLVG